MTDSSNKYKELKLFKERLMALIEKKFEGKHTRLARAAGVAPSTLQSWKGSDAFNPNGFAVAKVAKACGVSTDWLLTGEEPRSYYQPPELKIQKVPRFKKFAREFSSESYIPVRLLADAAAAGAPAEVNENDIENWALIYADKEWMPNDPEQYTCVHVRGKSMFPVLDNGDIVAIDHAERDPRYLDGKMVAFRVNGGVTIKWCKFKEEQETVVGVPENKEEFDHLVVLRGEEINDGIVGMVRWWWSKR